MLAKINVNEVEPLFSMKWTNSWKILRKRGGNIKCNYVYVNDDDGLDSVWIFLCSIIANLMDKLYEYEGKALSHGPIVSMTVTVLWKS